MRRATPDTQYYVILKHNFRTGESEDICEAVQGRGRAEATVERLNRGLAAQEKEAGWAFMLEAGIPCERQAILSDYSKETRARKAS